MAASASSSSIALADFDFELPPPLVAQVPLAERARSRLLVWSADAALRDGSFTELPELLRPHDALVLNDSRVFPARLLGRLLRTGAAIELLLVAPLAEGPPAEWSALARPSRKLRSDDQVELEGGVTVAIMGPPEHGLRRVRFPIEVAPLAHARRYGHVPLPPYIRRPDRPDDRERYQTVYARVDGSVAAPTAGLHLDAALLAAVRERGIAVLALTLHVGPGTFRPVGAAQLESGRLHPEWFEVPSETLSALRACRAQGGRVVAVGTTACRALESVDLQATTTQRGETALFIRPGHDFKVVDVLVSNFHLPRSSLLMLVAAFAGERWRVAYAHAVASGYRFFSYGDANWIERVSGARR